MQALIFGEILWDIIEGKKYLGGAPFNFAAHCIKCGMQSSIISNVGKDELGQEVLKAVKQLGVNSTYLGVLPDYPTGTVDVFLTNGQPDYTIHEEVAYDFITSVPIEELRKSQFDIFYFGSLIQRSEISRTSLREILENITFEHVFYDINIRRSFYSKGIIEYSLRHCTIFKINDEETTIVSKLLYGMLLPLETFAFKIALDFNIPTIIITAGENGCYILADGRITHVPSKKVDVQDAVGAGDSFSAAFMGIFTATKNPILSAQIANKIGGYVATQRGAIPEYSEEIKGLFKRPISK